MRKFISVSRVRAAVIAREGLARSQRGITTVLMMLLLGLALGASVVGGIAYIRGNQEQSMTAHAQTQAQMNAWAAAELVRQYLQSLNAAGKLSLFMAKTVPFDLSLSVDDAASKQMEVQVTAIDAVTGKITVKLTGLTATGSKAAATAQLMASYSVTEGTPTTVTCDTATKTSAVFRGDLTITGGQTGITSGSNYQDIAVEGNLSITSASTALISGCVRDNITLNGGGIDANATLSAGGRIQIDSMSPPSNATLWAKEVSIGNSGQGTYSAIKAGAFAADVISGVTGTKIGTAYVGGTLIQSTVANQTVLPWRAGTLSPQTTGRFLITLTDGSTLLIDMSKVTVDSTTGTVSGMSTGVEQMTGSGVLPGSIRFVATDVYGGGIDLWTLTIGTLWGHDVKVKGTTSSASYTSILANGELQLAMGTVDSIVGGSALWSTSGDGTPGNYWNFAKVSKATIAGDHYYQSSRTLVPATSTVPNFALTRNKAGTTPGLPGIPYCDTRTNAVDADNLKTQANYVFEFVNGKPQLTIQNVKSSGGASVAGIYPLTASATAAQKTLLEGLMICDYGNNKGCFPSGTSTEWVFSGVQKFPVGIVWFDRAVTFSGTNMNLLNTVISKGSTSKVTLTTAGHQDLYAPNFSTPALVCDGAYYPTNICDKTSSPSKFVTYTLASGSTQTGLPLANMAIMTEAALASSGWTINGHVMLGMGLSTDANATRINGTITVGANTPSPTNVTAGGFLVDTTGMGAGQQVIPKVCPSPTPSAGGVSMSGVRYL